MAKTLYLVLENGKVFEGYSLGSEGEVSGEVVFNTAVLGYNEMISDPAYCGQILVQTFPLIGNYGIIPEELENKKPALAGYIIKSICDSPSNFRCDGELEDYLRANNIVALGGIDTRELTQIIRDNGTMNGKITNDISNIDSIIAELKENKIVSCPCKVSIDTSVDFESETHENKVCLVDLGCTQSFIELFVSSGIDVTVLPYNTSAEKILNSGYDGVILSPGPGNPNNFDDIASEIKKIITSDIPVYACGLGHELVALALGTKVVKHPYGHRGANQPVKDIKNNKIYITAQNHGYIVDESSLPSEATVTFVNVNDKTVEGFDYKNNVTTQFAPNLCNGPHNTYSIIASFKELMKGDK